MWQSSPLDAIGGNTYSDKCEDSCCDYTITHNTRFHDYAITNDGEIKNAQVDDFAIEDFLVVEKTGYATGKDGDGAKKENVVEEEVEEVGNLRGDWNLDGSHAVQTEVECIIGLGEVTGTGSVYMGERIMSE